jgi:hypothetical protein
MAETIRRADPGYDYCAHGAGVRRQIVFLSVPGFAASRCFDAIARQHHDCFNPADIGPHDKVGCEFLRGTLAKP